MKLQKLSVKSFIGDLPRIINAGLEAIENAFATIYDEEKKVLGDETIDIKCKSINASGDISAYGDIKIYVNGEPISLLDLYNRVLTIEKEKTETALSRSLLTKKKLQ